MGTDGIFLITQDDRMVEMTAAPFISEDDLQDLLARHSSLLAGGQITPGAPRRWLLISREMGLPGEEGGSDTFSVDHLFVDQDAIPTIVEVKRSSDTRIRREVVGQMLDYAANGVRNWPVQTLRGRLERSLVELGGADAAVMRLTDDDDVEAFWSKLEDNLRLGKVRMIFVADVIPPRLQRIVEFLNEQMSQAEVLAIEMRQYVADGHRVLVPALIGSTMTAKQVKRQTEDVPFEELMAGALPAVQAFDRRLTEWGDENGWVVKTTRRSRQLQSPRGPYGIMFYPQFDGDGAALGNMEVSLRSLHAAGMTDVAEDLAQRLDVIAGRPMPRKSPQVPISAIAQHWRAFFDDFLPVYIEAVASVDRPAETGSTAIS